MTKSETQNSKREYWSGLITDQINSGLPKKRWCRENGVSISSLRYWSKRLGDEAGQDALDNTEAVPDLEELFEEIDLESSINKTPKGALAHGFPFPGLGSLPTPGIKIEVAHYSVVVSNVYDSETFRRVMRDLGRCLE